MPKTVTHGSNADCPAVARGSAEHCPSHVELTPEERLHNAILSFAHAVNNDLDEVVRALCKDGQDELAGDLVNLRNEWRDASQAAFDSFGR